MKHSELFQFFKKGIVCQMHTIILVCLHGKFYNILSTQHAYILTTSTISEPFYKLYPYRCDTNICENGKHSLRTQLQIVPNGSCNHKLPIYIMHKISKKIQSKNILVRSKKQNAANTKQMLTQTHNNKYNINKLGVCKKVWVISLYKYNLYLLKSLFYLQNDQILQMKITV